MKGRKALYPGERGVGQISRISCKEKARKGFEKVRYKTVRKGTFVERPNRFIARVMIDGKEETVHVKNTGRCRELLIPGVTVYAEDHGDCMGARKTRWDLIAVEKPLPKGDADSMLLINMDSQAPNKVVAEGLRSGAIRLPDFPEAIRQIKPETTFGGSRFDFYVEGEFDAKAFIEVKGVTLEVNGTARFPDAPTERGIRHINELVEAGDQGYFSYIIFVIQMQPVLRMEPNDAAHKAFGDALRRGREKGIHILAFDCLVARDALSIGKEIPVFL